MNREILYTLIRAGFATKAMKQSIAKNAVFALWYALGIRKRWPEGEAAIAKDPLCIYCYCSDVIKGRWPEVEQFMADSETKFKGNWGFHYCFSVLRMKNMEKIQKWIEKHKSKENPLHHLKKPKGNP